MENLQLQYSLYIGIASSFIGTLVAIVLTSVYHRFSIRQKKKSNHTVIHLLPSFNPPEKRTDDLLSTPCPVRIEENPLWLNLEKVMAEHELWRDPDLTVSTMIERLHTNRTSFSNAIRDGGHDNFHNYLANYRIEAFCRKVDTDGIENVQDAFFEVGYKARTTAFNQFKKIKGVSPSEYIKLKSTNL